MNLMMTKLHRINVRIVGDACVKHGKNLFIGVGDIHPHGQNFQIFCHFKQKKITISQEF